MLKKIRITERRHGYEAIKMAKKMFGAIRTRSGSIGSCRK